MKQFFKYVLGSCLGIFLFLIVLAAIGGSLGLSAFLKNKFSSDFDKETILVIDSKNPMPEKSNNIDQGFSFEDKDIIGLHATIDIIEDAKTNDKIKGIYLKLSSMPTRTYSNARILRTAIKDFKESGKWVYAFSDYYSHGAYYLASVADSIFVNKVGGIDFRGLGVEMVYYKEMLDKLGIEPQVFYAGKFKSATESIRRNNMSPENRLQVKEFISDIHKVILQDISESRGISVERLHEIADNMDATKPKSALEVGMVDAVYYKDQVLDLFKSKLEVDKYEDIEYMSTNSYYSKMNKKKVSHDDKIAIVIAEGTIRDNSNENGLIDGDRYARIIRKLREDDNVKAIVLRVNSPGGSVLASDKIWRELDLAKKQGITLIASMGDYAASGGYYISCMADSIFAQANTITGSIGVFGINYNLTDLANNKLGIYADTVRTNRFSALGMNILPMDDEFKNQIQSFIDTTYSDFKHKVAIGRNMTMEEVEEIAQGRVWTGQKALEIKLVDKLGDLKDAIKSAAILAELDGYELNYYPKIKKPFEKLLDELKGANSSSKTQIENAVLEVFPDYQRIIDLKEMNGKVQVRMPYELKFN